MDNNIIKIISAMIVAAIVATGTIPSDSQMVALYRAGFWDGSTITTETASIEVKDGTIYHPDTKQFTEAADISLDFNEYTIDVIAEGTVEGEKGVWYIAVPWWSPEEDTLLCFDSKGRQLVCHHAKAAEEATASLKKGYITLTGKSGKILKVKVEGGKFTRYKK